MTADAEQVTCMRCGARRDPKGDPTEALAWTMQYERGRSRWLCPPCSRAHVRDIESKLPTEVW